MKYMKLLCLLTCIVLNLSCGLNDFKKEILLEFKKLSVSEIRTIIANQSSVEEIQSEVDSLLSYYGDDESRFSFELNQKETQALNNLADALGGMFTGIEGKNPYMNEPGYVSIRFNGHINVQFLMIFRSEEDLSVIKSRYKHVINNIYVRQ